MNGPGDLVKKGSGNLKITGLHTYTGPTYITSGTLETTQLRDGGQPSGIGASTAEPGNLVLDGGQLKLTGSSSSDRGITVGPGSGTLYLPSASASLSLYGIITGSGRLDKTGSGDLTLTAQNDWSGGMTFEGGTLLLGSEEANLGGLGTGKVTLKNAGLAMLDNRNSYTDDCLLNLVVPQGSESWLYLDSRCSLAGSLEGAGILNVYTPYVRSEINGDWSAFSGQIKVSSDYNDAWFLPGSQYGFGQAAVALSDNITMLYARSEDAVIHIGSLSGTAGSELGAGGEGTNNITWVVGERNNSAEFAGLITNRQYKNTGASASIVKTGTGNWTLSNANTYSGTTEIQAGILTVSNTTGSATGNGDVLVRSGAALRGNGSIGGRMTVEAQASVAVGTGSEIDMLTVDNDAEFLPGSYLSLKIDPGDKSSDRLVVNGHLRFKGILYITSRGTGSYAAGDNYQIFDADTANVRVGMIFPSSPGEGLAWDTTWLSTYGFLHITKAQNIGIEKVSDPAGFSIYPNPGSDLIEISLLSDFRTFGKVQLRCYDPQGRQVLRQQLLTDGALSNSSIDVAAWKPGIYVFILESDGRVQIRKFLKQ